MAMPLRTVALLAAALTLSIHPQRVRARRLVAEPEYSGSGWRREAQAAPPEQMVEFTLVLRLRVSARVHPR